MEPKIKDRGHLHKSEELGKNQGAWCLKFPGSDRTVMLRTERYRYDLEKKRPSQIQAYMQVRCLQKKLGTSLVGGGYVTFADYSNTLNAIKLFLIFKVSSLYMSIAIIFIGAIFGMLASFKFGRYLLETFPGLFSLGMVTKAGPPKEKVEGSFFKMTIKVYYIYKHALIGNTFYVISLGKS